MDNNYGNVRCISYSGIITDDGRRCSIIVDVGEHNNIILIIGTAEIRKDCNL